MTPFRQCPLVKRSSDYFTTFGCDSNKILILAEFRLTTIPGTSSVRPYLVLGVNMEFRHYEQCSLVEDSEEAQ